MTIKRFGKRLAKITGIILGILAVLLLGFHIWFVYHAKALLEDTVEKQTGGKINLEIDKLHYNYFTRKMVLEDARFYTTDSLTAASAYQFSIPRLQLKLRALLPLLLDKKLLIDSLQLLSPEIKVTTLRYSKDTVKRQLKDISIPHEMGKVYKSIRDGLRVLKVNRFLIDNGTFILVNKASPDQLPLRIGKINFQIDNLQVDTAAFSEKDKILFSDNIILNSSNQHIIFPDGRHSLSYRKFRINLKNQLVQFDSCTIAANRKDSTGSSFRVFFDSLLLTHIDFDTLYRTDVIKADSVYCINPAFSLYVELGSRKDGKKNAPKLENIIEQLTGNLRLGYVGVKNGDVNIRTTRDGKPSSFVSRQNNFDMEGLQVDQDAAKPIRVKRFTMAIRNYENFIRDSSYRIRFDSILFLNDRITLSSFLFENLKNGKIINTFSVPRFSLEGLSWDQLVFEKRIRARLAVMYQPHISYTAAHAGKKESIFESLGAVNEYMDLEQLDITDGDIDLHLRNNLQLLLNHANLSVQSNSLLTSTRISGIRNSLNSLDFTDGKIQAGDLLIVLNGIRYTGNSGRFSARGVGISNVKENLDIKINNASIQQLQIDEKGGTIDATGIDWANGYLQFGSRSAAGSSQRIPTIFLKKINGANTKISTGSNQQVLKTDLAKVTLDELYIKAGQTPVIKNLHAEGTDFYFQKGETNATAQSYRIADNNNSSFTNLRYHGRHNNREDSLFVRTVTFIPDIQSLLNGELVIKEAVLDQPHISLRFLNTGLKPRPAGTALSAVRISNLLLRSPELHISQATEKGTNSLHWQGQLKADNFLTFTGVSIALKEETEISIARLGMYISNFTILNTNGKRFSTGKGSIESGLEQIQYTRKTDDNPVWSVYFRKFIASKLQLDSLGKNSGHLAVEQAALYNFHLGDSNITKLKTLATINPLFRLQHFTGHYIDAKNRFLWFNAGFNRKNNMLTLDSFAYEPALERDSFLATKAFQSDYIKASFGALTAGPLLTDEWFTDTLLHVRNLQVNNATLTDYKDKTKPFKSGLIKPLPANLLRSIPVYLRVDSASLTNASVEYTELHKETRQATTIPVKRMTVALYNIKNKHRGHSDSLRINATGYLLDTAWVRLQVRESYTDTLGGFLMTARLKAGDISNLNLLLIPLAAVKLVSGKVDTIELRAIGREYMALGEMKMFYSDLKVEILKSPVDSGKTLLTRLKNFIANTFVIRRNNHSKTGDVFFIRQRDRSAINYLVRIALSGISSSVGARNNKKMIRRYQEELKKRKLPPIEMD